MINIGLIGMEVTNINHGVNALAYCNIHIIQKALKELGQEAEFTIFSPDSQEALMRFKQAAGVRKITAKKPISLKKPSVFRQFIKEVEKCDIVFDVTGGDSFSDIYGDKRFVRETVGKSIVNWKSKLVLAPQTIGPFKKSIYEWFASRQISKARLVYARDEKSLEYSKKISGREDIRVTCDVAFLLPYEKPVKTEDGKIRIGINVSALLWYGGFTRNNQFGLTLDYQKYTRNLIEALGKDPKYELHLISHVFSKDDEVEDDYRICKMLTQEYPACKLGGIFSTPVEAKSYIAKMDVFIGARMHSTIGAISSHVATIPVSYSRKFEGLFHSIGYQVGIDCRSLNVKEALDRTLAYVRDWKDVQIQGEKALVEANQRLRPYLRDVYSTLKLLVKEHKKCV